MSLKRPLAFTVSAPGKVILHGEHSVVYGKTALAASLNLRTNVTLKETGSLNGSISIDLPNIELQHVYSFLELNGFLSATPPLLEGRTRADFNLSTPELIDSCAFIKTIKEYVRKSLDAASLPFAQESALVAFLYITTGVFCSVNFQLRPFSIQGVTDLAIGSGAGSSASFAVCLSAALIHYIRSVVTMNGITHNNISKNGYKSMELKVSDLSSFNKFEKDLICRWALASEKIMHGNPSGLDNSICTFGSVIKYKKGFDGENSLMEPIPHVSGLKILLVNSGIQRDTVAMVEKVATRYKAHPRVMVPLLDAMDGVAQEATLILEQMKEMGDTFKQQNELHKKLEELVDINQALLSAIGVSHPKLDQICSIVKECGLHAKLTGAGGGGFVFVLLPPDDRDHDNVRKVKEQLTNRGFLFNETELGGPGITVQNLCSSF